MFEVKFKWDKKSFVEASLFAYRYELSKSPKRFLGFIFIAMSQFGVVALLREGQSGLLLLSSILLIYWYFLREKIRKKIYEKSFRGDIEFTLRVDESGLNINGLDLKWSDILKIIEFEYGFIIYYQNQYLFIPNSAFDNKQRDDFISILRKKNIKISKSQI
jgi:hypothetical protein